MTALVIIAATAGLCWVLRPLRDRSRGPVETMCPMGRRWWER